jgi:hypothetical protein
MNYSYFDPRRPGADSHAAWGPALSRRQFVRAAAAATGLALSARLWVPPLPAAAQVRPTDPRAIPGSGFPPFHIFEPAPGNELSTITDFSGLLAVTHAGGSGRGTDTRSGQIMDLLFDADMRFQQGRYIGADGREYTGTFGFV